MDLCFFKSQYSSLCVQPLFAARHGHFLLPAKCSSAKFRPLIPSTRQVGQTAAAFPPFVRLILARHTLHTRWPFKHCLSGGSIRFLHITHVKLSCNPSTPNAVVVLLQDSIKPSLAVSVGFEASCQGITFYVGPERKRTGRGGVLEDNTPPRPVLFLSELTEFLKGGIYHPQKIVSIFCTRLPHRRCGITFLSAYFVPDYHL